jgi:hypothetical protein
MIKRASDSQLTSENEAVSIFVQDWVFLFAQSQRKYRGRKTRSRNKCSNFSKLHEKSGGEGGIPSQGARALKKVNENGLF